MTKKLRFDGSTKDPDRRRALDEGGESVVREGWRQYRKTQTIWARRVDQPFVVDTLEGPGQAGKPGDFLAMGVGGEMYPIDAAIFAASYEEAD